MEGSGNIRKKRKRLKRTLDSNCVEIISIFLGCNVSTGFDSHMFLHQPALSEKYIMTHEVFSVDKTRTFNEPCY